MADNTCICCGRIIPEGRHICLHCGDYDDQQTFRRKESAQPERRYFRIADDCGWTYHIVTDRLDLRAADIVLLVPHVRSAAEITQEEFEEANRERI